LLRERAANVVNKCLAINAELSPTCTARDTRNKFDTYEKLLIEAKAGFAAGSLESIHGSMFVCVALFDYGEMVSFLPSSSLPSRRVQLGNSKVN
jgi:hypothetical protein